MAKQQTSLLLDSDSLMQNEGVRRLVELFGGPLAAVQFPGVDGESLSAEVDALEKQRQEVSCAEAALLQAKTAVAASSEAVLKTMKVALSYARVYADSSGAEWADELASISLPGTGKNGRGPKKKVKAKAEAAKLVDGQNSATQDSKDAHAAEAELDMMDAAALDFGDESENLAADTSAA